MIFLIGLPGVDYDTVGNKIAAEIGYDYINLYEIFKRSYKKEPIEIYKESGYVNLCTLIRLALTTYIKLNSITGDDLVVSMIPGIVIPEDLIKYMKSNGQIWHVKSDSWKENIKDSYKLYVLFDSITEEEFDESLIYIESIYYKKCKEFEDLIIEN